MLEPILHWLGVPGQLVTAAGILFVLYHLRGVIKAVAHVGTLVWIATIGGGVVVAGLIALPGVDVSVQAQIVIDAVVSSIQHAIRAALDLAPGITGGVFG